jgi:hypothetical protein
MAGAILGRILTAGTVEDEHGNVLPLRGNISAHQGQRISACIGRLELSAPAKWDSLMVSRLCISATQYPISRIPITS